MRTSTELLETCNRHFAEIFERAGSGNQILISYFGHFSQDTVNRLLEQVEEYLNRLDEIKKTVKRVFSIVVEGLQNILLHGRSTLDDHRLGFFTLSRSKEGYHIFFGNFVSREDFLKMEGELNKINNMTPAELKEYHKEVLFKGKISRKGGAGLGLIISRMKSDDNLKSSFSKLTGDMYFYTLQTFVEAGK